MEWVLSVIVAMLAYLTFGNTANRPQGLRVAWLAAAGVIGVQALSSLILAVVDGSGSREVSLLLQAVSWGILAFIVFSLASANVADDATSPGVPPVQSPPVPPQPPAAPPGPPPAPGTF